MRTLKILWVVLLNLGCALNNNALAQKAPSIKKSAPITDSADGNQIIVIGPKEIAKIFKVKESDVPSPPTNWNKKELDKAAELGRVLILRVCEIRGESVNIKFLRKYFGAQGVTKPNLIDDDELSQTNLFILTAPESRKDTLQEVSVCGKPEWVLVDLEIPVFSIPDVYGRQLEKGLYQRSYSKLAVEDIYDLVISEAVTGRKFRQDEWSRTGSTLPGRLDVIVGGNDEKGIKIWAIQDDRVETTWGAKVKMAYQVKNP